MRSRILAHRGYWLEAAEKNSLTAFRRAFEGGFGIETDIRDLDGELVISHDPPASRNAPMPFSAFLDLYRSMKADGWLALNIKADGLAQAVAAQLAEYGVANAFVFDMSVPDMRGYLKIGATTFTRRSDVETAPSYYAPSQGVWLDCFEIPYSPGEWIRQVLADDKRAALVSPELHGRSHEAAWAEWRETVNMAEDDRVMLCTDIPEAALNYFRGTT